LLRIKEEAGSKWKYTYVMNTFIDPKGMTPEDAKKHGIPGYGSAEVKGTLDMEVKSVKDGKTTFYKISHTSSATGKGIWKEQAEEMMKEKPLPTTYTWDERMTNVNIAKEEYADPMTNSLHTLFPKDPVKVGTEWEYQPFPAATKKSKAKVVAIEKLHGRDTVKIAMNIPGVVGDENTLTVWFDPKNGRYLKFESLSKSSLKGQVSENHLIQDLVE